jgi:hypothetical protein
MRLSTISLMVRERLATSLKVISEKDLPGAVAVVQC